MRIAIALCTYNGAEFLGEQLDSFLAQTRLPDEVVIRDDCSTDATFALCQDFARRASARGIEVRLAVNPANLGYVRNFEGALRACTADLLFLSDQDDAWHPEKLARYESRFLAEPDLVLLHGDARLVDAAGQPLGCGLFESLEASPGELARIHAGRALEVLLLRNLVTGATAAFRRGLLDVALPVRPGWIHDEWLAIAAAASGGRVDCLEWASMDYRQHGRNQVGARKRSLRERMSGAGPRREFLARMAGRHEQLAARAAESQWQDAAFRTDLLARARHLRFRAGVPASLFQRCLPVLREAMGGGYWRYSSGLRSLLADLAGLA